MKAKTFIFFLSAVLICMSSCSNDDGDVYIPIAIAQSDVVFDAEGGDGYVSLRGSGSVASVTSSDDWCTASFDGGSTVNLRVPVNPSSDNRNAVVTVIDDNGNEVHVAVSQTGSVYVLDSNKVLNFGYNDSTAAVSIASHNIDANLESSVSWLTAKKDGNSIVVNAVDNNTGTWRCGVVRCYVGSKLKDSIVVVQVEDKDIYGDYYMTGDPVSLTSYQTYGFVPPSSIRVSLSKAADEGKISFSIPSHDVSADFEYDQQHHEIVIPAGQDNVLGYEMLIAEDHMDVDPPFIIPSPIMFFLLCKEESSGYEDDCSCNAYLSTNGNDVVWKLKDNGSWTKPADGLILDNPYMEEFYKGIKSATYFAANNLYIIKADKYKPAE